MFRSSLSPLILYHLYSSLLNRIPTYFLKYLSFVSFRVSFVSVSSPSLYHLYSSLLNRIPTYLLISCNICPLIFFLLRLSLSPLLLYHLHHPFSIASPLISCNIFPLFLFVFHLSLSPLILYHLYSPLLNRIPTYFVLVFWIQIRNEDG